MCATASLGNNWEFVSRIKFQSTRTTLGTKLLSATDVASPNFYSVTLDNPVEVFSMFCLGHLISLAKVEQTNIHSHQLFA